MKKFIAKIQLFFFITFKYEYLREYKRYYKNNPEYFNKIKYKIFFKETWLNLCLWWNTKILKNNHYHKLFVNIDNLFLDIEECF